MPQVFAFGEQRDGYAVPVLNERAVRAAAGIAFVFAMVAFMNAWLTGDFQPTRVFVVAFLIDFIVRVGVNPMYAPSLIVGQWMVRRQQPEWVGAPQKRFAWVIGLLLAAAMLYLVVLRQVVGPLNLAICALCLLLLFFESAFGICIGCKLYNAWHGRAAQSCPGGSCDAPAERGAGVSPAQAGVVLAFAGVVTATALHLGDDPQATRPAGVGATAPAATAAAIDPAEAERCKVPDFAKAMGHEQMWKLHNNCR